MRSSFCVTLDTIKCFHFVPAVGTRGSVGEEHGTGLRILHQLGCIPGSIAYTSSTTSNQFPRQQGVCSIKPFALLRRCHVALVKHLDLRSCFPITRRPRTAPPRYDNGRLHESSCHTAKMQASLYDSRHIYCKPYQLSRASCLFLYSARHPNTEMMAGLDRPIHHPNGWDCMRIT